MKERRKLMKTAIILFLSTQLLSAVSASKQQSQDAGNYILTGKHLPEAPLPHGDVPVISKGHMMHWNYSDFPIQDRSGMEKPFAVLPNSVSIGTRTKRLAEAELQKKAGRKNQNGLRKMARNLVAKYSKLNVFSYLTDNLTGGHGMAIPA
jgi:hypothetical protein